MVIGLLVSPLVNNWNERRKVNATGKQYLKGIKADLQRDLILADSILNIQSYYLSVLRCIDSMLHKKFRHHTNMNRRLFIKPDSLSIYYIFDRNTSFRPVNGAYKSLIAYGKSCLIINKQLFQVIQQIYDGDHERLTSTYEAIKYIE